MKSVSNVVVDRINKYLNEKNMSQYKLAELSGVPFATIKSLMQRRTKTINFKTIIMLSAGLGVTPSEFINDDSFLPENIDLD